MRAIKLDQMDMYMTKALLPGPSLPLYRFIVPGGRTAAKVAWARFVVRLTGGLTEHAPVVGIWQENKQDLSSPQVEEMSCVDVMCSKEHAQEILGEAAKKWPNEKAFFVACLGNATIFTTIDKIDLLIDFTEPHKVN